jgi:hypothetical protein
MRYPCYFCGKSVSSELPDDSVIRAMLVCPECIEARRVIIPDTDVRPLRQPGDRADRGRTPKDPQ